MLIDYQVVAHSEQRYETAGDWWWDNSAFKLGNMTAETKPDNPVLHIRVSKMSDPRHELLVFHHELTEALLCREAGVTAEQVDAWDEEYERRRGELFKDDEIRKEHPAVPEMTGFAMTCGCWITRTSEPGDDIHAPYHAAHATATECERKIAKALGVGWAAYNDEVAGL